MMILPKQKQPVTPSSHRLFLLLLYTVPSPTVPSSSFLRYLSSQTIQSPPFQTGNLHLRNTQNACCLILS